MPVLYVRIPDDRIGAVIGPGGATKRRLERATGSTISIEDEDEGVAIRAPDGADPIGVLRARDIVLAIGRGFAPERAERLLHEGTYLAVLDMKEMTGKRSKEALRRIRSRVIGREGRARDRLETLSGCSVSVYGRTVALIGDERQMDRARRAVTLLLRGSEHATVFRMLAHGRRTDALEEALRPGAMAGEPEIHGEDG